MIKSVFIKYITAFMLIIFISFTILISVTTAIMTNYSTDAKADVVENSLESSVDFITSKLERSTVKEFETFVNLNREDLLDMITVAAGRSEDITIILTNNKGKIILYYSPDVQISDETYIPKVLMDEVNNGLEIERNSTTLDIFKDPVLTYAEPVYNESSIVCGTVFACSSSTELTDIRELMIKTLVLSSLCVMLAALVAIYFISEKVIGPLKEMSLAAKAFAAGDFGVRVKAQGKDEVAELAEAFNNMAQTLSNSENMRNIFMASASHELRTPMTSIAGYIDNILSGAITPEQYPHYLNIISTEVHRLSRLISSLLDMSRLQAGERKFNMKPFDICEMARIILISLEIRIDAKKLDVGFECDDDNMYVFGDKDAIHQIIYNICDNAVKFSYEKGKFIIRIHYAEDKKISISIYNEGQGIEVESLPYVFELFYKTDKSRGLDKTGVGLGLYIAKTIVNVHGGEISVKSEFGKNCEFTVCLPRKNLKQADKNNLKGIDDHE